MPRPDRQRGFTLIEMIVVLAVLALVATLVLYRGPPRSATLDLREAATTVAGTLRLARTRAIAANAPVAVIIDPATARLTMPDAPPRTLPRGIAMAATPATVTFHPDGSATAARIDLATRGRSASVTVDWLSGQVSTDAPR